jgi:RNA polymerase sigma-70 factor (ECF subfamily)
MSLLTAAGALDTDAAALADVVEACYERRGREVWGLARRLGATAETAADVVQEAHLRLWRELLGGAAIDDVEAWVFRVAYRLVMDQHRVSRRIGEIVARLRERGEGGEGTDHLLVDDALSLWPLVDRLPARERATLYLRYRSDLSFEQVGTVMGISTAAARSYASRGVERLRQRVGSAGGFE